MPPAKFWEVVPIPNTAAEAQRKSFDSPPNSLKWFRVCMVSDEEMDIKRRATEGNPSASATSAQTMYLMWAMDSPPCAFRRLAPVMACIFLSLHSVFAHAKRGMIMIPHGSICSLVQRAYYYYRT